MPDSLDFMPRRILALTLCFGLLLGPSPALAKTRKPTLAEIATAKATERAKAKVAAAAKAKLDAAQARLRVLARKAAQAKVAYDKSTAELATATQLSKQWEAKSALAAAAVSKTRDEIGRIAIGAYKMGGGFSNLDTILRADGPQDLIDRLTQLTVISTSNTAALHRFQTANERARTAKISADAARAVQANVTIKVAAVKKVADAIKADQQQEVDSLMALQNKLMDELSKARDVRVTLEEQRQLALLEEQRFNRGTNTTGKAKVWPNRGLTGRLSVRTTTEQRLAAVNFAKQEVNAGKPYVWGAQGPNAYDCSGLVYAAYKAAGLRAPSWSRLNAALYFVATKRIPLADLEPGDLVFRSYDGTVGGIYHVSIYAGNNMVWEARNTKSGLKYSPISGMDGLMPFGGRV